MEERKFVCKYCKKKYPCGKSLGGHIRTHMSNNEHSSSPQSKEVHKANNGDHSVDKFYAGMKRKRDFGYEEEDEYENPTMRMMMMKKKSVILKTSPSSSSVQKERFCKECGKGFLSVKALCGHMAVHSEKDKGNNNCGFSMKQKMVMDSHSDTETCTVPHNYPKKSRRMRFKTVNVTDSNYDLPSTLPIMNASSSVSDVDQEEEIAKCLMLLSKDSSHRGRLALPTESSDNNSVVVEMKSESLDLGITYKNGKRRSLMSNGGGEKEKKMDMFNKNMKLKSAEIVHSDDSDSEYFRNGPKIREFKRPKVEEKSGFEFDRDYEMLIKNKERTRISEPRKLKLEDDFDYDAIKDEMRRAKEFISWRNGVPCKKMADGFQSEKLISGSSDSSAYESDESSTDTDAYPDPISHSRKVINRKKMGKFKKKLSPKKSKEHICSICYRIFKSGQALGGHKKSHFVGASEENTLVIRPNAPVAQCLIDLNQPAPADD